MLTLPAELTHRQASACLLSLEQQVRAAPVGAVVVVNAQALKVFDTAALAVLLAARRLAFGQEKNLLIQGLPAALRGMAGLYGVDALLPQS
jgi:phospholipid transport system transporter-binding protein